MSKTRPKQSVKFRERVEEFLQKNPAAIKKIPPEDIRNLFEDLQVHQVELEQYNNELRKAHKQLRESEEQYRQLFSTVSDAVMVFDAETKEFIDANDAVSAFYGYTKEEFLELKHTDITAELEKSDESIKQTVAGEISSIPIRYHKRKDGTMLPVEISTGAFKLGNRQMVFGVARDISDRKRAEEALQESEERFRTIFETAEDSIFIKDRHLRYTLVNPTMERLFGVPASQLLGKSDEELFGDEAGAHIREVDSRVLRGEIIEEEGTKPVSGVSTTFHVIKVPMRNELGEIIGLCGIARDITKQKQAKEALKKAHEELEKRVKERTSELRKINDQLLQEIKERKRAEKDLRKYERMVAASNDHMSLTNRDYVYQVVNDAYLRGHNVKREDIVGRSVPELCGQEFFETHQKPMIDRCLAGEVVRYQSWIDFSALGRRYMDIAYYSYFEDDGSISGCVVNARDITESKEVEKALRESEERYKSLFKNNHSVMLLIDPESANIVDANPAATSFYGWSHEELTRKKITSINTLSEKQVFQEMKRTKTKQRRVFYFKHRLASGKIRDVEVYSGPIKVYGRELLYSIIYDITKRKQAELSLIKRRKELENKTHELEEVNAALKVLLKHRDEDKKEFEEKVIANVKKLVFPYVDKLNNSRLNDRQAVYLDIIKSNLEDVIAPFLRRLSSKYSDLTPKEIQIAGFVKDGKTTKEIAELLNSSTGAVDFHRNNLRKKLGLRNTKTNLRSFLLSLA